MDYPELSISKQHIRDMQAEAEGIRMARMARASQPRRSWRNRLSHWHLFQGGSPAAQEKRRATQNMEPISDVY